MKLEIIKNKKSPLISKTFLDHFLKFVEKALVEKKILPDSSNKKIVIAFISAGEIQKLNKQFLKKDYVTDVLSFAPSQLDSLSDLSRDSSLLHEDSFGELALCVEKIKTQAKEHNLTVKEETAYLVLHGFLHLLGYHHERGGQSAKKMYKLQDEIFNKWQSAFMKHTDCI